MEEEEIWDYLVLVMSILSAIALAVLHSLKTGGFGNV